MTEAEKPRISLPLFFVILFAICWIGASPMVLASYDPKLHPALKALQFLMLFGPAIAAIFVAAINGGKQEVKELLRGIIRWRVNPLWYVFALLAPLLVSLLSRLIAQLFGANIPPLPPPSTVLSSFAGTFIVYFFLNTEELAWRGYALPRLQEQFGFLKANVILGMLWGVFHIPIFMMKGGHPAGYDVLPYLLMVFAMTFIFGWVFNATGRSVLIVHLLHQGLNAWAEAVPAYPRATVTHLPFAVMIVIFCIGASLVVIALRNRRLQPSPQQS